MGADFSRVRINPLRDYAGVELGQGRVLLDADANELMAIVDRRLRALASDTLDRSRVSSTTPHAFKIAVVDGTLEIGKGRLYVDGLLAENHGAVSSDPAKRVFDDLLAEPQFADPISYAAQPYFPEPPLLPNAGRHLVYLDVWDREVTHLEQPDLIESAAGVDTSSRLQTVWQVRVLDVDAGAGTTCASPDADLPGWSEIIAPSTGVLRTGTFDVSPVDDPCELPPTGGYRGLENQLYRVEIHEAGKPGAGATFKWSRENASICSRVVSMISDTELELETLGRDDVLRFSAGDWVEIIDDTREFSQTAGEMRQITHLDDATRRIQFTDALPATMLPGSFPDSVSPRDHNLRVCRWDQSGGVFRTDSSGTPVQVQDLDATNSTGVIAVPAEGTTLLLENGVTVSFASTGDKGFRPGDHWVFAARTADASVEILDRAPPRGIHHHYERLAIWDVPTGTVTDCRHPWPPDVEGHDCSCTACVTAETHASGQFTIQDAVNQVRETGGTICLGPGQYAVAEPVRMVGARSVRIHGQGPATTVFGVGEIFALQDCLAVAIENLAIISLGRETALSVHTAVGLSLRQLVIIVIGADAKGSAIALQGVLAAASICENAISARIGIIANDPAAVPPTGEEPFLLASALRVEDNVLFCTRQAVALSGAVLHVMSTHIVRNEVFGCVEAAISALGLGAPASTMVISANTLVVPGNGIRCGLGGAWIEGNKINHATLGGGDANDDTIGIAMTGGFDKSGVNQCQILSNQLNGFGSAGIEIAVPVRELIVKLNIIENCGNGIVAMAGSSTGSVSIENNLLRNIGPRQDSDAMVIGIAVARADGTAVAGNTIRGLGVQAQKSPVRAAILTFAVLRPRVSGNDVSDVAPPGEFIGTSAGIMLRAPYTQFEVNHNQVQRDATLEARDPVGRWSALVVADFDRNSPISRLGKLATVRVTNDRVLVLNEARASIWAPAGGPPPARGSVLGNALTARGSEPVVDISVGDDCLFNDNRVESLFNRGSTAVRLETTFAIVHANRVRGGEASIDLTRTKLAAVLGNITTGVIAGFTPPPPTSGQPTATWDHLNLRA